MCLLHLPLNTNPNPRFQSPEDSEEEGINHPNNEEEILWKNGYKFGELDIFHCGSNPDEEEYLLETATTPSFFNIFQFRGNKEDQLDHYYFGCRLLMVLQILEKRKDRSSADIRRWVKLVRAYEKLKHPALDFYMGYQASDSEVDEVSRRARPTGLEQLRSLVRLGVKLDAETEAKLLNSHKSTQSGTAVV